MSKPQVKYQETIEQKINRLLSGPKEPRMLTEEVNQLNSQVDKLRKSRTGLETMLQMYRGNPNAAPVEKQIKDLDAECAMIDNAIEKLRAFIPGGENIANVNIERSSGGVQKKVSVLYDFNGSDQTQLTVKSGDVLAVLEGGDEFWVYASFNGAEGYVPKEYVKEVVPVQAQPAPVRVPPPPPAQTQTQTQPIQPQPQPTTNTGIVIPPLAHQMQQMQSKSSSSLNLSAMIAHAQQQNSIPQPPPLATQASTTSSFKIPAASIPPPAQDNQLEIPPPSTDAESGNIPIPPPMNDGADDSSVVSPRRTLPKTSDSFISPTKTNAPVKLPIAVKSTGNPPLKSSGSSSAMNSNLKEEIMKELRAEFQSEIQHLRDEIEQLKQRLG